VKALATFFAAAASSALLQLQLNACLMSGDCDCDRTPDRPAPQVELSIQHAYGFTNEVLDELPFDPVGGTLEITGDQVIIRYEHEDQSRAVVYEVLGPGAL